MNGFDVVISIYQNFVQEKIQEMCDIRPRL